ncbi:MULTISPECIES: chromate transporter [unclassified Limnohabitans]|uniref:chromate transporter n=1 Tax=unclassified Limnohabitans TaxID=2626134 RepID=UPI000A9C5250|nr:MULTISPECIES: chromate transporter [unclassified Limnohabitans]PUE18644.1 chromate transporter [Limnohabitans sp. WS1]
MNPVLELSTSDWLSLFNHFASLSLLAVGGAITVAPDMHRFLVEEKLWLSESQFTSSIALAQAAPGPNILFVALMGFNVGMNAGASLGGGWMSVGLASLGLVLTLMGIMLPSSVLTYTATRWAHQHRDKLGIRAFKSGMAPIVIALLLSTSWLLTLAHNQPALDWPLYVLTALTALVVWRTQVHMLWLIGLGALLGGLGWV